MHMMMFLFLSGTFQAWIVDSESDRQSLNQLIKGLKATYVDSAPPTELDASQTN